MFALPSQWGNEHWTKAGFRVTKVGETFLEVHATVESKI